MAEVIQVKNFEKFHSILDSFCNENNLTEERKEKFIQTFRDQFSKENTVHFLLSRNGRTEGFMSCALSDKIISTQRLFVEKSEDYEELLFELIDNVSKQLESYKKDILQIFFVNSLTLEKRLAEHGFAVHPRVKMVYNLNENSTPDFSLAADYQETNFTLDRLDEELQVIVDAFKHQNDSRIFTQFDNLDDLTKFFNESNIATDRLRADSPIILNDGKIVGVNIVINLSETASYIWIIALLPEHRGHGLGKFLMLKSHENCKKANIEQMILDVTLANTTAHNLYKKLGYKETIRYLTVIRKFK